MNFLKIAFVGILFLTLRSVAQKKTSATVQATQKPSRQLLKKINQGLDDAVKQYSYLMHQLPDDQFPRTYEKDKLQTVGIHAWISGFYPGTLLYLYQFSKDSSLKNEAYEKLKLLKPLQFVTNTHDLGFMMYCSYGNAYRLDSDSSEKEILVQSAKSLSTRFNPGVGCIQSWNNIKSLDGKRILSYPVIIDNMMNLELLFFASKATGDPSFKHIAISHAATTMKNHLRPDYSSYHVVDYDTQTGEVKSRETMQGFSDNSTWARGEAWGIYGFTVVYRETKDKQFLQIAQKMADYFIEHLPKDKIPYWDFNINQPGYTPVWKYDATKYREPPRDASAAAIAASALIELSGYVNNHESKKDLKTAEEILASLLSPAYRATGRENGGFILKHGTGGFPGGIEVDVPLTYADYYFVEAMLRYKNLSENND
jgi:unsaturated chondroitin disaccharide hydrolase